MTVLPGVLACRTLRRTVQVRLGIQPPAVARWHTHLHGLETPIHEISGLALITTPPTIEEGTRMDVERRHHLRIFASCRALVHSDQTHIDLKTKDFDEVGTFIQYAQKFDFSNGFRIVLKH